MPNPFKKKSINVPTLEVYKAFWAGIKADKGSFFFTIFTISTASIIQIFIPLFYKKFFDVLTTSQPKDAAPELLHIIMVIMVLNACVWLAFRTGTFTHNFFQTRSMARLRQNAFEYLIGHSYSFFSDNFGGSLVQRINRFARAFERLADRLIWNIIPLAISIAGISVVLWSVNPEITLLVLFWLAIFMIFNYFFSKWKLKYNVKIAEADSLTTAVMSDDITNQNSIQLFTNAKYEVESFKKVTGDQAQITNFTWNLNGVVDAVQSGFLDVMEFLLFYFAVKYWQAGVITVGTFVLIQVYFISLGSRLWDFSRIVRDVYEGFADAKETLEMMLLPHEIHDSPIASEIKVSNARIEYQDVLFNFNQTREVINHINLTINSGEKIALIGPSGAGKSTFIRLLFRMHDVTSGQILIDGQNINGATQESLRKNMSLVPQDPVLFHRSLKENIRYGRPDANDEEVLTAARLAHCDEFVKALPFGYDTYVGERGIKLSGGERQRVVIARAILKNAPILVLDEATSSLDSESESLIQNALNILMKDKTVIVIAHRLSTIRMMDRIIVLANGKIKEQGTHAELLDRKESLYHKLWSLQAGGFIKDLTEDSHG